MISETWPAHAIYEGFIRHRRFRPVENSFRYRVFFMLADLDRLDDLDGIHPLWSGRKVNAAYFRRKDHTGDPRRPLSGIIRDRVCEKTGSRPMGAVRVLTHFRYFGHCFNPVSFYYCHDAADGTVAAIVAEIHNTPWGEEHLYVLPMGENLHPSPRWRHHRFDKGFHISPFMGMRIHYDWRFRLPDERLSVHMISTDAHGRLFDASLVLSRLPVTRRNLGRVLLHYPVMTLKVICLIYWQALKLLVKGAPVYTHPRKGGASSAAAGDPPTARGD